jgi:hypothetical protein
VTGEEFRRLPWRITEAAFAVNPRALKVKLQRLLRGVLRDRARARRLLVAAEGQADEELAGRIRRYLEETR